LVKGIANLYSKMPRNFGAFLFKELRITALR